MTIRTGEHLLDVQTVTATVNAALTVGADPERPAPERARYVALMDRLFLEAQPGMSEEIARLWAIAAVASVMLRGPATSEVSKLAPLSIEDARLRLGRALHVDSAVAALPEVVRDIAIRLLQALPRPPEKRADALEVRLIDASVSERKFLGDFAQYKPLLKPLRLAELPDVHGLATELRRDFPWMRSVTELILRELELARYAGRRFFRIPPLLLVGEPGVAKTFYARRLGELSGVPFRALSAAGSTDSQTLRGTSRGWYSARPSAVIQTIVQHQCASPLILVDEIDKAGTSRHNGNVLDALLLMLDPVVRWYCESLEIEVELSYCSFIATANSLSGLPRPLLDRFQIVHVPRPGKEHFPALIDSCLRRLALELGLPDPRLLPELTLAERQHLVSACENVRQLARAVRHAVQAKLGVPREAVH